MLHHPSSDSPGFPLPGSAATKVAGTSRLRWSNRARIDAARHTAGRAACAQGGLSRSPLRAYTEVVRAPTIAAAFLWALGTLMSGESRAADDEPDARRLEYRDDRLTVDLQGAPLADLLTEFGHRSGAKIRGHVRKPRDLNVSFDEVPLPHALERLLGEQNFTLRYGPGNRLEAIELLGEPGAFPSSAASATATAGSARPPDPRAGVGGSGAPAGGQGPRARGRARQRQRRRRSIAGGRGGAASGDGGEAPLALPGGQARRPVGAAAPVHAGGRFRRRSPQVVPTRLSRRAACAGRVRKQPAPAGLRSRRPRGSFASAASRRPLSAE